MGLADAAAVLHQFLSKREKKAGWNNEGCDWVLIKAQKILFQAESDLHGI